MQVEVKRGDTYETIARKQYGDDSKAVSLARANPGRKEPLKEGTYIFAPAGLNIIVGPQEPDTVVTIVMGGLRLKYYTEMNFDMHLDGFSTAQFKMPFDPDNYTLRDLFKPLKYQSVIIYVGKKCVFTGTAVTTTPQGGAKGTEVTVSAYSRCAVLNDCTAPASAYPLSFNGNNFKQIIETVVEPYGIKVNYDGKLRQPPYTVDINVSTELLSGYAKGVIALAGAIRQPVAFPFVNFPTDPLITVKAPDYLSPLSIPFEDVSLLPGRKVLPFLITLAKQRGLLIRDTSDGNLMVFENTTNGSSSQLLKESESPVVSVEMKVDGQQFYSHISGFEDVTSEAEGATYTLEAFEPGGKPWVGVDPYPTSKAPTIITQPSAPKVKLPEVQTGIQEARYFTVEAKDSTGGSLETLVQAKADRMYLDAIECGVILDTWRNKDGVMFLPGQFIELIAPTKMVYKKYKFQIRSVRFSKIQRGISCGLTLSIPTKPKRLPWDA